MASRLYLARAPSFTDLETFVIEMVCVGIKGGILQGLKAKCRELARADSAVLVAPTAEFLRAPFNATPQLWLVAKNGYFSNKKLRERLKQLQLKVAGQIAVSHAILQACYQFTATARLAPKWNQVKGWLVKGTEFLSTGKTQALDLEVGVTSVEITLTLTVHKVSLSFLKVEDLGVTTTVLNHFSSNPYSTIRETNIDSNRCLLLPNFTVGYIFSASHHLPQCREFQSYDSVRLHWKKQHGIILPEKQSLYYQIFFKSNPGNLFTYPGCCVFKSYPLVFPSKDSDVVASAFVTDLHSRMPSVCGEPVKFSTKALAPFAELSSATEHKGAASHSNIRAFPQRPQAVKAFGVANLQSRMLPAQTSKRTNFVKAVTSNTSSSFGWFQKDTNQIVPSNAAPPPVASCPQQSSSALLQTNEEGRIVPVFKSKSSSSQIVSKPCRLQTQQKAPAIVPVFKATNTPSTAPAGNQRERAKTTLSEKMEPPAKRPCFENHARKQQPVSKTTTTSTSAAKPMEKRPPLGTTISIKKPSQFTAVPDTLQTVPDLNRSLPSLERNLSFSDLGNTPTKQQPQKITTQSTATKKQPLEVQGVNAETMKKLHKTKAALLRKWLLENGMKCRSKEKKEEMVRMAALHIKQTGKIFSPPV